MGVTQTDVQTMFSSIDPSQIASFAEGLLSSLSNIFSFVLLMLHDAATSPNTYETAVPPGTVRFE